ncbi:MAG: hypothetical protein AAGA97_07870 [Pseudomonadota bacterium]
MPSSRDFAVAAIGRLAGCDRSIKLVSPTGGLRRIGVFGTGADGGETIDAVSAEDRSAFKTSLGPTLQRPGAVFFVLAHAQMGMLEKRELAIIPGVAPMLLKEEKARDYDRRSAHCPRLQVQHSLV